MQRRPHHSAHIGHSVQINYRWHPYYGFTLKYYRTVRRADGDIVLLEREAGTIIQVPAWMLDAVICSQMEIGVPVVSLQALKQLHTTLKSEIFGKNSGCKESTMETLQNEKCTPTRTASTASGAVDNRKIKQKRTSSDIKCTNKPDAILAQSTTKRGIR